MRFPECLILIRLKEYHLVNFGKLFINWICTNNIQIFDRVMWMIQNLRLFNAALRTSVLSRYRDIVELNYFDSHLQKFPYDNPTKAQRKILWLFRFLLDQIDGSQPQVEGIRTHFITTNYDYVIETILDNVVEIDDSLFLYTYRGITPTHVAGQSNISPIHQHWLVQHLLKINGGLRFSHMVIIISWIIAVEKLRPFWNNLQF